TAQDLVGELVDEYLGCGEQHLGQAEEEQGSDDAVPQGEPCSFADGGQDRLGVGVGGGVESGQAPHEEGGEQGQQCGDGVVGAHSEARDDGAAQCGCQNVAEVAVEGDECSGRGEFSAWYEPGGGGLEGDGAEGSEEAVEGGDHVDHPEPGFVEQEGVGGQDGEADDGGGSADDDEASSVAAVGEHAADQGPGQDADGGGGVDGGHEQGGSGDLVDLHGQGDGRKSQPEDGDESGDEDDPELAAHAQGADVDHQLGDLHWVLHVWVVGGDPLGSPPVCGCSCVRGVRRVLPAGCGGVGRSSVCRRRSVPGPWGRGRGRGSSRRGCGRTRATVSVVLPR